MQDLPIIILAAGDSSRMRGRDKLLEGVDGAPLLRQQVQKAIAAHLGPVFVALPHAPHPRYDTLTGLDATAIPVKDAALGMSASLRKGLKALPPDAPAAMILLADLPEITTEDLNIVAHAVDFDSKTEIWRGATEDGKPGHPVVIRRSLFPAVSALRGDTGAREVIAQSREPVKLVPLRGDRARCDLDTPEDWAAWRAARKARQH